jgi:hypothetical protein
MWQGQYGSRATWFTTVPFRPKVSFGPSKRISISFHWPAGRSASARRGRVIGCQARASPPDWPGLS